MIKNYPTYADDFEFVVAVYIDNEYWFYGAYDDRNKANMVAKEVGGSVFE